MSVWFGKVIRGIIWKVILSGEETQPVLREKKIVCTRYREKNHFEVKATSGCKQTL